MSHAVESMFYYGQVPWHGLGKKVSKAPNSAAAIKLAGLDWEVIQAPIYASITRRQSNGQSIPSLVEAPGVLANVRETDGSILGIVTPRYKIVQNREAFAFTDLLLGEGVTYETAGSLHDGKKIWLLARMPKIKILDDETVPYLVFSNSHDGSSSVKVAITPVRVVCQNTLRLGLQKATRTWSTTHVGDITKKLDDAQTTLDLAKEYIDHLKEEADKLAQIKIDNNKFNEIIHKLIPLPPERPEKSQKMHDALLTAWKATNLKKFHNTGWGAINAVSDFATHYRLREMTQKNQENLFEKVIDGHEIIDQAYELILAVS